jgi:hypothetical protein
MEESAQTEHADALCKIERACLQPLIVRQSLDVEASSPIRRDHSSPLKTCCGREPAATAQKDSLQMPADQCTTFLASSNIGPVPVSKTITRTESDSQHQPLGKLRLPNSTSSLSTHTHCVGLCLQQMPGICR